MQSFSLLVLGLWTAPILATKMLLPLYRYPEDGSWDNIYSTIQKNPALTFQVILNVDSGPGDSSGPNSDFAQATAKLNAYPNVETLGYVHTGYGATSQDDVNQNVSAWNAWNSYSGANASIHGIFYDEVHNTEGDDSDVSYMQSLVQAALTTFASRPTIVFNPGSKPEHLEFYDLADYVVVFETYASEYSDTVLSENVPTGYANQSAILIPDFASVGTASQAETWLKSMVNAGIASAHILNYDYLQSTSNENPAAIGSIASALAGLQGSSTAASTGSSSSGATVSAVSTTTASTKGPNTVVTTTATATTPTGTATSDEDGASSDNEVDEEEEAGEEETEEEEAENEEESGDDAKSADDDEGSDDAESADDDDEQEASSTNGPGSHGHKQGRCNQHS